MLEILKWYEKNFLTYFQTETDESHAHRDSNLKAVVGGHQRLKLLRLFDLLQ